MPATDIPYVDQFEIISSIHPETFSIFGIALQSYVFS